MSRPVASMKPPSSTPALVPRLRAQGATDTGRQRDSNEDRFYCDPEHGLFIVVDGVGGYAAGEVAAELACYLVSKHLRERNGAPEDRLRAALTAANNEIYRQGQAQPGYYGMACVLTAVVVEDGTVTVGHVGDTRLYEVRQEGIRKVTRDHSPVGLREDNGDLSEIDAMNHPRRSEILRDLGSVPRDVQDADFVDVYRFDFASDSALLLCSDGLTDLVPKMPIHQVVMEHAGRPEEGLRTLIELANEVGGQDNITAVWVEGPAFGAGTGLAEPAETFAPPLPEEAAAVVPARSGRFRRFLAGLLAGFVLALLPLGLLTRWLDDRLPADDPAPPPSSAVRVVAADGTGSYTTISAALAAAQPGDVVMVAPGVYPETVHLRDSVAVVSTAPGAAVIRRAGLASADSIAVIADGVRAARFEGFQVGDERTEARHAVGVLVRDAAVDLTDVVVTGAREAGVRVEGASRLRLRAGAVVANAGVGLHVRGPAVRAYLAQNVIRGNGTAHRAPGLLIEGGAVPVMRRNLIVGNAGAGILIRGGPVGSDAFVREANFFQVDGEDNAGGAVQAVMP